MTTPNLYVSVRYTPQPGQPDAVRISCESTENGDAISTFLSPLDAMIDAVYCTKPGETFHVIPASRFDPGEFIRNCGGMLRIVVHLGWAAHDRKLVLRHRGTPASAAEEASFPVNNTSRVEITVPQDILAAIDRLHEHAGLFDYREPHGQIMHWDEQRRHQAVAKAIHSIPDTVPSGSECTQIALYDPEGEQWHFVPIALLDDEE